MIDAHPHAEHPLAERRDAVHAALVPGRGDLGPGGHEAVLLEVRQGPVDGRAVDLAEVQLAQVLLEAVAVAGLLGQQEQDRREHEPAWGSELEPRGSLIVVARGRHGLFHVHPRPGTVRHAVRARHRWQRHRFTPMAFVG